MKAYKMTPVTKDYIWGGTRLHDMYGKGGEGIVAESWEVSCHPDGESLIDGESFAEYIRKNPDAVGSDRLNDEFPVLIKFIDAAKNLSVQVHPNDEYAREHENDNGKTEMWYIVDAAEDAKIVCGMARDADREAVRAAIVNNTLEELLDSVDSKKGDVFFVEAGTVHAIGAGNLVLEIQQNSNVTYRLYDYGRLGADGKPRALHIDKGVECANTKKTAPKTFGACEDGARLLAKCDYFEVREYNVNGEISLCADERSYHALVVTDGAAKLSYGGVTEEIHAGDSYFIPAGLGEYTVRGSAVVILTKNPEKM